MEQSQELSQVAEEMKAMRQEFKLLVGSLSHAPASITEKTEEKKDTADANELQMLRRIVRDFHPTAGSKTYKELVQENQVLKKQLEDMQGKLSDSAQKCQQFKAVSESQEKEILQLRKDMAARVFPASTEPVVSEPQKHGFFRRLRKNTLSEPVPEEPPKIASEDEKRSEFRRRIFSQSFSDEQVRFLAGIYSSSGLLPADCLLQLADPRLSVGRMQTLYGLLCSQHGVKAKLPSNQAGELQDTGNTDDSSTDDSDIKPPIRIDIEDTGNTGSGRILELSEKIKSIRR